LRDVQPNVYTTTDIYSDLLGIRRLVYVIA